jgi:hypothetical protein
MSDLTASEFAIFVSDQPIAGAEQLLTLNLNLNNLHVKHCMSRLLVADMCGHRAIF